jgi:hypothetical protein
VRAAHTRARTQVLSLTRTLLQTLQPAADIDAVAAPAGASATGKLVVVAAAAASHAAAAAAAAADAGYLT